MKADAAGRRSLWLVDDAPIMGGAELLGLRLARLARSGLPGYEVKFVCPPASLLARRAAADGVPVADADFPELVQARAGGIPKAIWHLRGLVRNAGRDAVVVGTTARAQAYLALVALVLRHRPPIVHLLQEQETASRPLARLAFRSGGLVALGENVRRTYQELLPGASVYVANNLIDPDHVSRLGGLRARRREGRKPALGVLGRLIPSKGVLELVDELADARDAWSSLTVVGTRQDAAYADRVEQLIKELGLAGRVRLAGYVEDLDAFFDDIDALVVPSVGPEGQPTVILEALAHGRPCLVRERIWSRDFERLPVVPFRTGSALAPILADLPDGRVDAAILERRFGAHQLVEALERAAGLRPQ